MKAQEGVLDLLNEALTIELTAVNQYFLAAKMCEAWGLGRLHDAFRRRSLEEMQDIEDLMSHILYLEGLPNVQRLGRVRVGQSVPQVLQLGLELEMEAIAFLRRAITHCTGVADYTTRARFEAMIQDEERHADWFETELEALSLLGLENYAAQQRGD